ncbi:DeoR/GlpR family DNA-binding transcription regulator [Sebaldella sp. S0638]|uniref:DeoR/GlpR family DNA-binding transcription regulator n=1 Tax=Sebaldella sp. S0638 TaxID=2957809 RepID=UPI0020A1EFE0|nr:DeoR/GlpR family DNA-binding transcription regulator [Sebaldella sp. S0638]MCP1226384.1 DeoR/GlpR family DNA-binding transcription regulator [Sebaldella sp. S0638]
MKTHRIKNVEEYILKNESVSLDKLCDVFKVSKNTIRRDIKELLEKGKIKKIYGGVTINQKKLVPFEERNIKNHAEKKAAAEIAAAYINDGDIIFIDSGTTTMWLIDYLKNKNNITILTNNLSAIISALPYPNLNIISLGGTLKRKTNSFVGNSTSLVLKDYNISKAFMAATGISIARGATNSSVEEYELKKLIVEKSDEIFLLVDSSKFDIISLMTYSPLENLNYIITNKTPPKKYTDFFRKNKINLLIAEDKDKK